MPARAIAAGARPRRLLPAQRISPSCGTRPESHRTASFSPRRSVRRRKRTLPRSHGLKPGAAPAPCRSGRRSDAHPGTARRDAQPAPYAGASRSGRQDTLAVPFHFALPIPRYSRRCARRNPIGLRADRPRLTMTEIGRIRNPKRQQIGQIRLKNLLPDAERPTERTCDARRHRCCMQPLAPRCDLCAFLCARKRGGNLRVALGWPPPEANRRSGNAPSGTPDPPPVRRRPAPSCRRGFQIMVRCLIKCRHRRGAIGAKRQPAYVALRRPMPRPRRAATRSPPHPTRASRSARRRCAAPVPVRAQHAANGHRSAPARPAS